MGTSEFHGLDRFISFMIFCHNFPHEHFHKMGGANENHKPW